MEMKGNNEKNQPSDFEKFKFHLVKHKKKYIIGGLASLSFGLGFYFGNRGNSRRHYTRLLQDGVQGAVKDGMKDLVDTGMRDVVKDGMKDVVTDVVREVTEDVVKKSIRNSVRDNVKNAIAESAVTIIKQVESVAPKPSKDENLEELKDLMKNISSDFSGVRILYDAKGNAYAVVK